MSIDRPRQFCSTRGVRTGRRDAQGARIKDVVVHRRAGSGIAAWLAAPRTYNIVLIDFSPTVLCPSGLPFHFAFPLSLFPCPLCLSLVGCPLSTPALIGNALC